MTPVRASHSPPQLSIIKNECSIALMPREVCECVVIVVTPVTHGEIYEMSRGISDAIPATRVITLDMFTLTILMIYNFDFRSNTHSFRSFPRFGDNPRLYEDVWVQMCRIVMNDKDIRSVFETRDIEVRRSQVHKDMKVREDLPSFAFFLNYDFHFHTHKHTLIQSRFPFKLPMWRAIFRVIEGSTIVLCTSWSLNHSTAGPSGPRDPDNSITLCTPMLANIRRANWNFKRP